MRTAMRNVEGETVQNSLPPSGLCLSGTVTLRTKRDVPANNPTVEIVTYVLMDSNGRHYYVDDYSPSTYYEVGQSVILPVYIKPYKKKNGDASYSLNVLKPFRPSTVGEAF